MSKKRAFALLPAPDPIILENPFDPITIPKRMIWTASALKTFRECKRLFFWKYIMRLKPKGSAAPLIIGSAFHEALGKWYQSKRACMASIALEKGRIINEEIKKNSAHYDQEEFDKLQTALETLQGMLEAYAEIYATDKQWIVDRNLVETKFSIDLGDFQFEGKVDLVAQEKKKAPNFIGEHKTASTIPDSYIDRLPLDTQVRAYIYGALFGKDVSATHVLYNVVKKCKLRRKSNESVDTYNKRIRDDYVSRPSWYFFREKLMFSKSDIAAFQFEMFQTHKELVQVLNGPNPEDPRNWSPNDQTCSKYFKTCAFLPLCANRMGSEAKARYRQGDVMHEELAGE